MQALCSKLALKGNTKGDLKGCLHTGVANEDRSYWNKLLYVNILQSSESIFSIFSESACYFIFLQVSLEISNA